MNVLFIDLVDPDNIVAGVVHALNSVREKRELQRAGIQTDTSSIHIVITTHKICFGLSPKSPKMNRFYDSNGFNILFDFSLHKSQFDYESYYYDEDHRRVQTNYLAYQLKHIIEHEVPECKVIIYESLDASDPITSHALHACEEFYYKSDGTISTKKEYEEHLDKLYNMNFEERVRYRIQHCMQKQYIPYSIEELVKNISTEKHDKYDLLVGGPFTGLHEFLTVANEQKFLLEKQINVVAMGCSWNKKMAIFGESFNCLADWKSFKAIVHNYNNIKITFVTTDTCKTGSWLTIKSDELRECGYTNIADLMDIRDKNMSVSCFDLCVVIPSELIPFKCVPVDLTFGSMVCNLTVTNESNICAYTSEYVFTDLTAKTNLLMYLTK